MKMKIAMKNETEKKQIIDNEDNGSELPKPQKRIYTENIPQYNQITSLLTDRLSKGSILNRTN